MPEETDAPLKKFELSAEDNFELSESWHDFRKCHSAFKESGQKT